MELSKALANQYDPFVFIQVIDDSNTVFMFIFAATSGVAYRLNCSSFATGEVKIPSTRPDNSEMFEGPEKRKKQEIRVQNAQRHAAVSVAGVSAAVAALAASNPAVTETATTCSETSIKESTAMAFAAALVVSHCIEIAEDMGAGHEQI
ncbi:hypothetical protein V6N13_094914 [Hibiscus sabdariffa]|uniref:VAN3-binding protein-like auxin canalisation domain-containing protein n=1 Tax=Hibiscus sabdariffa TaxID=183260 RepID=A0ABR2PTS5_9ROSI